MNCLLLTPLCYILTHLIRRAVKRHLRTPNGGNKAVISRGRRALGCSSLALNQSAGGGTCHPEHQRSHTWPPAPPCSSSRYLRLQPAPSLLRYYRTSRQRPAWPPRPAVASGWERAPSPWKQQPSYFRPLCAAPHPPRRSRS